MNVVIRSLTRADQNGLWDMLYYAIHVPAGEMPPPREIVVQSEIARYVQDWGNANDLGFGAFVENKMLGAAWLRLFIGDGKGYGYWDDETPELSIALTPEYRGMGIGAQLLQTLLDAAAKRFDAISLSVAPDNRARYLYERFGFKVVRSDEHALVMLKNL